MQRIRSAVNTCSAELRPLRHQLRYTTLRSAILKWTAAGMLMYVLLYTSFYIVVRNNYLFGLSENTSQLLMEQYTKDLMQCWHHLSDSANSTIHVQTNTELSFVTVDSIAHNGLASTLRSGIQVSPRTVVVMHAHANKHSNNVHNNNSHTADKSSVLRNLLNSYLDAGSCIATPHQDLSSNEYIVARRLRSTKPSKAQQKSQQMSTHHKIADHTHTPTLNITSSDYSMRCLPSFIIAGAMKCGTGELMKWLELHPNLAVGSGVNNKREVHYFTSPSHKRHIHNTNNSNNNTVSAQDTAPSKDTALVEYASYFPEFTATQATQQYTFEKSPDYIRDRAAVHSIHQLMPSMRIIVLLRNPALRALSEFSHHCRHGRYVKFTRDVHLHGTVYRKNSVVRNDNVSGSGSGGNATSVLAGVSKSSYKTLAYPCTAADAELYFTQYAGTTAGTSVAATTASSSVAATSSDKVAAESRANVIERDLARIRTNMSVNTITDNAGNNRSNVSGGVSKQHSVVPELEHGFYDQQLASLLEIFPASQVLVLLQEDMYRHTFRTLRQVEEFLQIPCFDYAEYAFIPTSSNPGPQDDTSADSSSVDTMEGVDNTDDGFYDTSIAVNVGGNSDKGSKKRKGKGKRKAGKGGDITMKPPKRVPISYEEQIKHYKAELKQYLSSWHGAETSTTHLYYDSSPTFQQYLNSVYRTHNKQLSELLYGVHKIDAFSSVHLSEMGWDMQEV